MSKKYKKSKNKKTNSQKKKVNKNNSIKVIQNISIVDEDGTAVEDYGIDLEIVEVNTEKLIENGYEVLPKEAFARVSAILQYLPGMIANEATIATANTSMNEIAKNTYRVIIKDGMHLAPSKITPMAYRGTLLSNVNNQIQGQAEWLKLKPMKVTRLPQLALGVFNVMSVVTCQYYLASINNQLRGLETTVNSILSFLEDDKNSKLWADDQILNQVLENYQYIIQNELEKQAVLFEIKPIKRAALSNIQFYRNQIQRIMDNLPEDDKNASREVSKRFGDNLPQYWCAVNLYSKASLMEVLLAEMDNPDYLDKVIEELRLYRSQYEEDISSCVSRFTEWVREAKSLNVSSQIDAIKDHAISKRDSIIKKEPQGKAKIKKAIIDEINSIIRNCREFKPIDDIRQDLEEYRMIRNSPVELIQTSDAVYIKYKDRENEEDENYDLEDKSSFDEQ